MIPFNKPYFTGKETKYIEEAVAKGKISGDGFFTKKCHEYFENKYGFKKCLLTTSCTDALEMAAILLNIKDGDEVIAPSYTFVSTVNAFVLRGAKIIFADSHSDNPNIDEDQIEQLISPKTKAIIVVHYAGIACNMDKIMDIAKKNNLFIVEDAAQAIDSFYTNKLGKKIPLGSIGHLGTFSFHETKNIISGEGGMLVINDEQFIERAEIIREKGTNRTKFFRGEVDKYSWVDMGSSFLPSEIIAAFLYAQLENLDDIQNRRKEIWNYYYGILKPLEEKGIIQLPIIPDFATNNAHMFYFICKNLEERTALINYLKENNIWAVFHYLSLHESEFYKKECQGSALPNANKYTDCLIRLPFFYELKNEQIDYITRKIFDFYGIDFIF
ncbi:MAG: dTDP-4-amino-4,6-dideoxygalactose transaminase [Sphingobacteriales bacterium]|nr:MAG: dTDP-4-amino-4,6-dideoxygalactose transaminase [Sphingobacteriales bacterium]